MSFGAGRSFHSSTLDIRTSIPQRVPGESPSELSRLLTRILEATASGNALSEALASGRARNLSEALSQLNPTERQALQNRWGRSLAEIESLSQERDPQIFYHGLLQIGQRLEDNDQLEQAGLVYSALVAGNSPQPPLTLRGGEEESRGGNVPPLRIRGGQEGLSPVPAGICDRAQTRLNAMTGIGASGERIAFLARRISTEATRPDMLLAMGAAGAAFRLTRLATTARLAGTMESTWGLRAAAYGSGFLAETVAFTGVGKVAGAAFGYQQDWSPEAVFHEWAGGATMLLGLKVTGALAGAAAQRYARGSGPLERFTQVALPQVGMFGGILLGHRLEEAAGFRTHREGDTWLVDGLSTLLQFNVAGRLQSAALGEGFARFERRLDLHTEMLSRTSPSSQGGASIADSIHDFLNPDLVTPEGIRVPQFSSEGGPASGGENRPSKIENLNGPLFMVGQGSGQGGGSSGRGNGSGGRRRIGEVLLELPRMGVREDPGHSPSISRLVRGNAEIALRELLPNGELSSSRLGELDYVPDLLKAFGITSHALDVNSFMRGFEIAKENPERVRQMAFDIDEVYLHWAIGPSDLFASGPERGLDALYHHTSPDLLRYEPFEVAPGVKLNFFQRVWFHGIQGVLQGRMRQNLQLHPGVRAFQLGLRLGSGENLTMATTGPAGRILLLANEDPAMRMIYFGKTPTEPVSIDEVRNSPNIYTREHLVLAMRRAASGGASVEEVPGLESYLRLVRENPKAGEKLKHPALAGLLGKRPFSILVDDSSTTFRILGGLDGFSVLQPPSARPGFTLNFTLRSRDSYLDRMSNGYVTELANVLFQRSPMKSQSLVDRYETPADYPHQRFAIEIPWRRFGREFVGPARELRFLASHLRRFDVPSLLHGKERVEVKPPSVETPPANPRDKSELRLSESQLAEMSARLQWEFGSWTAGKGTEVAAQSMSVSRLRDLAQSSPQQFAALLERHFTERERERIPQSGLPTEERATKYFARVAGLLAAKRSVFKILGMDLDSAGREVEFRFGPPLLEGEAKQRLFSRVGHLQTSMASDGEVGVGMAFLESSIWDSGLVGFGIDLTTDRVRYTSPEQHALAEAAYKATLRTHEIGRFNHYRAEEIRQGEDGSYTLSGKSMRAARELRGDPENPAPLPIRARHFRIGEGTVALVGVPALSGASGTKPIEGSTPAADEVPGGDSTEPALSSGSRMVSAPKVENLPLEISNSPFPYLRDDQGKFRLPREGMSVVVLGDIGGVRTWEAARQGARVLHIDRDPEFLDMSERLLGGFSDPLGSSEPPKLTPRPQFFLGDWYETQAQADLVEAYFPLSGGDIPFMGDVQRRPALENFLHRALLSKLSPQGSGFLISENPNIVRELEEIICGDPSLKLLEAQYDRPPSKLPLVGGYSSTETVFRQNSWLVFSRIPGAISSDPLRSSVEDPKGLAAWSHEVERLRIKMEADLDGADLPAYPLDENRRVLVATGFFFNEARLSSAPATLEERERDYRGRFSDREFSVTEEKGEDGTRHRTLFFGLKGDRLAVQLREFFHEGQPLLHIQEFHEFDGLRVPLHEDLRYRMDASHPAPEAVPVKGGVEPVIEEILTSAEREKREIFGMGPETEIERRLSTGRRVDPWLFGAVIEQILEDLPSGLAPLQAVEGKLSHRLLLDGRIRYRRLEALHRLLLNGKDPNESLAVDNGPGPNVQVAVTLAGMGTRVLVKELPSPELNTHRRHLSPFKNNFPGNIEYVDLARLDEPVSADVVYWTNPNPSRMQIPREASLIGYLGRDVKPGGFLVVQSDQHAASLNPYQEILRNPQGWDVLFDSRLVNLQSRHNFIMPTGQELNLHLQIFRRNEDNLFAPHEYSSLPLPYQFGEDGRWTLRGEGMRVAVLGDLAGSRSYELAAQGHRMLHLEPNESLLREARRRVADSAHAEGRNLADLDIRYLGEDGYEKADQVDLVEVFFPERELNRLMQHGIHFESAVRVFLRNPAQAKLAPQGRGVLVLSHDPVLIGQLTELAEQDPGFQVLDDRYSQKQPPILDSSALDSDLRHSWLLYRRRP